jgi:hypothetical protein
VLSLKYALSTILAIVILTISLSGILQPSLSLYISSIDKQISPNSLKVEAEGTPLKSMLGCMGCSGNGNGPG